jgi:uncharacterized surface protein with fasciclin (FAS1) repeats
VLAQAVGHRRLSPVGDHLDDIDQVLGLGAELAETRLFGKRIDGDVMGCLLALGLERIEFLLQGLDLLLQRCLASYEGLDMLGLDGLLKAHGGELGQTPGETEAGKPAGDIVDVAVGAGSFTTLVEAMKAADLAETLRGEGPFTVFAPTDEAFAKIAKADLDALLADKEKLTAVLTYHVVPGKVRAADVVKLDSAKTVQGGTVTIDTSDGVKVDDAKVVETDMMASNVVIHVIDTVIMPK